MSLMSEEDLETLTIDMDPTTGEVTLLGAPPAATSWLPEVIDVIRRGETSFCTLRGDVIELRVKPETLWYRLTGEVDDFYGEVAVRCHRDGSDWA
jgi:hypothetical protein